MPREGGSTRQKNRLQGVASPSPVHLVDASAGLFDDQLYTAVALPSNLAEVMVTLTPSGRFARLQEWFMDPLGEFARF